jgi:hypothetical protein
LEDLMTFNEDNAGFEDWLREQCLLNGCEVAEADLEYKHDQMASDPFVFLRATFFRWAKRIETLLPELAEAPSVLSVGDTHLENFGTWRDNEGRLVWGVNDFDEAAAIPYPFDLVRLAASVRLADEPGVSNHEAAAAIAEGYLRGLAAPRPTLLDEQETWMRAYVGVSDKKREKFWNRLDDLPATAAPAPVIAALQKSMPDSAPISKIASVQKGMGSLGRPRFVALAMWRGGKVTREAKALVPSAWDWGHARDLAPSRFLELSRGQFRSPDPWLEVHNGFLCRRIAADSRKVNLKDDDDLMELHINLFNAMGFDLGAIHAADHRAEAVKLHLDGLTDGWLYAAAETAAADVECDFETWKQSLDDASS